MANGYARYSGLAGGPTSALIFADSIVNTADVVTLVNDSAAPGNSKYYGTNGSGTLGYFSLAATAVGNLTDVGTDGIVITGGTGAVVGGGTSIAQHVADASHNGYLLSTDWSTFNGKQAAGNYITALTGDATASGPGSAALTFATVNANVGSFTYASITVNGKGLITAASSGAAPTGTVTSVGFSVPASSIFGATGSPVTTSGTLGLTVTGTSGGIPYFDTTSTLSTSAALTASRLVLGGGAGSAPTVLGSLGTTTTVLHGNAAGAPSFGAVSLTADVAGLLPIASAGTGAATTSQNFAFIGPTSGSGAPSFRALVSGDLPAGTGTVTSVALSVPASSIFGATGSPVTTSGTLGLTVTGTSGGIPYFDTTSTLSTSAALTANRVVLGGGAGAAPTIVASLGTTTQVLHGNASGAPTFGAIVGADLPNPSSSTLGGIQSAAAVSHQWINSISTSGVPALSQPAFTDISGTATVAQTTVATQAISSTTVDWSTGNVFTQSNGSTNRTFTFSNQTSGQTIVVRLTQTTGTVTWPSTKWSGGSQPAATASSTDVWTFVYDGTSTYGSVVSNMS